MDNPQIAGRIRRKDPEALRAVIRAYLAQVLRAARAAGPDSPDAEEVTQATFTTFLEKAVQFKGKSHVRTWLIGILYNKIAEARRQFARMGQLLEALPKTVAATIQPVWVGRGRDPCRSRMRFTVERPKPLYPSFLISPAILP